MGYMFQLRDDLLDFTSDVLTNGKAAHKDFQEGIYTMPVLYALQQPGGREALLPYLRSNAQGPLSKEQLFSMESIVSSLGGVDATWKEIQKRQKQAEAAIEMLPSGKTASLLLKVVRKLGTV